MPQPVLMLLSGTESVAHFALWSFLIGLPLIWLDNHLKARRMIALREAAPTGKPASVRRTL